MIFSFSALAEEEQKSYEDMKSDWSVQGVVDFSFYSFYLGAPAINGKAYTPSFGPRVGPRILYKDFGTTITLPLPMPESEIHRRGSTVQRNFIANTYWRQNALDVYYQRYSGFYVVSPFSDMSFKRPAVYPQLPDAVVTNVGFNWYYNFDPESYSLKAAFDHTEFQLRSGGSWIGHGFYNHLEMGLGNRFVKGSDDHDLTAIPKLSSAKIDSIGGAYGYGYTYIRGRYFATAQGIGGLAGQYQQVDRSEGADLKTFAIALKFNINLAAGFNHKEYIIGAKVLLDTLSSRVETVEVSSSLASAQIFAGQRF